jgi:hypothetical protein
MDNEELRDLLDKATDGPWEAYEGLIWNVAYPDLEDSWRLGNVIAEVRAGTGWPRNKVHPQDANARLIAASPDLAAEVLTLRAEAERLKAALRPFAEVLSRYTFATHQLVLLSEDNPKGRRLAHLRPEQFKAARAALRTEGGE